MIINEKQYNYFNEIEEMVNGCLNGKGEILEKGLYSEPVYELNAPLKRKKDGTLYIARYEIRILSARLFKMLQDYLGQLISIEEKI